MVFETWIQVKITADVAGYAPAGKMGSFSCRKSSLSLSSGYVATNTQFIRGFSPLHDSGIGSFGLAVSQVSRGESNAVMIRELRKL